MFISELAYSFHLGSDKNRKNSVRNSAKNNISGTTSMSNNGIQNAKTLSTGWSNDIDKEKDDFEL